MRGGQRPEGDQSRFATNLSERICHVSRTNLAACRHPGRSRRNFRFAGTVEIDVAGDLAISWQGAVICGWLARSTRR